jgi:hypothetical protein
MHQWINIRVHELLHQRRGKMSRVEGDQPEAGMLVFGFGHCVISIHDSPAYQHQRQNAIHIEFIADRVIQCEVRQSFARMAG